LSFAKRKSSEPCGLEGSGGNFALFLTHFGFLLKVEFVDLLQLALQSEEEGSFVGLQRGLRVLEGQAVGLGLLGGEDGSFAQVLDELFGGVSRDCVIFELGIVGGGHTFLRAL
jgi:hypothetical protein